MDKPAESTTIAGVKCYEYKLKNGRKMSIGQIMFVTQLREKGKWVSPVARNIEYTDLTESHLGYIRQCITAALEVMDSWTQEGEDYNKNVFNYSKN